MRQGILSRCGIKGQQDVVRGFGVEFANDADHFVQFRHQVAFVVKSSRSINQEQIHPIAFGLCHRVIGQTCGIRAGGLGHDGTARAFAPDLKLFNRGGAEGIARRQHDPVAFCAKTGGELANRGGLARSIDPNHQNHLWAFALSSLKRLCNRVENFCNILCQGVAQGVRFNIRFKASLADLRPQTHGGGNPEVSGNKQILEVLEAVFI